MRNLSANGESRLIVRFGHVADKVFLLFLFRTHFTFRSNYVPNLLNSENNLTSVLGYQRVHPTIHQSDLPNPEKFQYAAPCILFYRKQILLPSAPALGISRSDHCFNRFVQQRACSVT
jgi:hypothetical protein